MSALPTTAARNADIPFAPHPLNEGVTPRAARNAVGASRPAPTAPFTVASALALDLIEAAVIAAFVLAVVAWATVFFGRG